MSFEEATKSREPRPSRSKTELAIQVIGPPSLKRGPIPAKILGMTSVADVLRSLNQAAPPEFAFEWDRIGLQLGDPAAAVSRAVVALDVSPDSVETVEKASAQLLLTHHPLIWDPWAKITSQEPMGDLALRLARLGCASLAAHTNWDCAPGGINDVLAERLGLTDIHPFGPAPTCDQLKLVTFVPEASAEAVIEALHEAGAGKIGEYERCAFLSPGTGTFRGSHQSRPAVGEPGRVERVAECRIEMRVPARQQAACEAALRATHPYEEPAFDWVVLQPEPQVPLGRIGSIDPAPLNEWSREVESRLGHPILVWGDPQKVIQRVAVIGGAADGEWRSAQAAGADAFLTGEVKHHVSVEAGWADFPILAAGHFATENPGMLRLAEILKSKHPEIDWQFHQPTPGHSGRPLASRG